MEMHFFLSMVTIVALHHNQHLKHMNSAVTLGILSLY